MLTNAKKYLLIIFCLFRAFSGLGQSSSILWEISGNGLQASSYLMGTIHISDSRVFEWNDSLMICFERCEVMAGELQMNDIKPEELAAAIKMPGDTTLMSLIGKKEYKRVKKYVKKQCGVMVSMVINKIKPVYTMLFISQGKSGQQPEKNETGEALDLYLQNLASERGMNVMGLETPREQLQALEVMSLAEQADLLLESLKETEEPAYNPLEAMIQAYLMQDLDSLYRLFVEESLPEKLMESLIYRRNVVMSDRMIPLMRQSPAFIAVGAAHLPGEKGLLALLVREGFIIRPVNCRVSVD